MGRLRIRLDTHTDAARLAKIASNLEGKIVITDGNGLRVNAKSVMGMLYAMEFEELWLESEYDIYRNVEDFVVIEG